MEYIIIKAQCKLSDGTTKVFRYDAYNAAEQNICDNIEVFREKLRNVIETRMKVAVLSILLTYDERNNDRE